VVAARGEGHSGSAGAEGGRHLSRLKAHLDAHVDGRRGEGSSTRTRLLKQEERRRGPLGKAWSHGRRRGARSRRLSVTRQEAAGGVLACADLLASLRPPSKQWLLCLQAQPGMPRSEPPICETARKKALAGAPEAKESPNGLSQKGWKARVSTLVERAGIVSKGQ